MPPTTFYGNQKQPLNHCTQGEIHQFLKFVVHLGVIQVTLRETNSQFAPENRLVSQKERIVFQLPTIHEFRCKLAVSFREGILVGFKNL